MATSRAQKQIDDARSMIEAAGIGKAVTPAQLLAASGELDKSLRETLRYLAGLMSRAEGRTP